MEPTNQAPKNQTITWVNLHLVPQNEHHMMPPFVTGILTQETPGAYVLMKMLQEVETEDGWHLQQSPNMHFINRTYVWSCEVLAVPPQLNDLGRQFDPSEQDTFGGLG